MKKTVIIFLLLLASASAFAQKYVTTQSKVTFYSYAPIEDIQATNSKGRSIIDLDNGNIVFSIPIDQFVFAKSLMQEHFNENYMESDKHPSATFVAQIQNWESFTGSRRVTAKGRMTIHGITREMEVNGQLTISNNSVSLSSKFYVKVADHDIKIPTAVFYNIAKSIEVDVDMEYRRYKR